MAIQPVGQPVYETNYAPAGSVGAASDERRTWLMNHASWGAIAAGVAATFLVQLLLGLLGLGLSLASVRIATDLSANPPIGGLSLAAALWWVVSGLIAACVGGIVAGRLCGSARHSTAAWHGFVAWCATTLLAIWLLGTALGSAFAPIGGILARIGDAAGGSVVAAAHAGGGSDGLATQVRSLVNPNDPQTVQAAILAYVQASVNGDKPAADAARQPAVDSLARLATISPEEAQNRLDQLQQRYQQSAERARQAAETARREVARGALFAFAALLLSGIASIVGGGLGTPRRVVSGMI